MPRWDVASTGKNFLTLPDEHSAEATRGHKIVMHRVSGRRNQIPAPKNERTLLMPASAINTSTVLRLAAFAALLGGGLVSPVLATPLSDETSADEDAALSLVDCCAQTAALLQDIAVLQRSLSQVADSLAASEARADALAGKLLESERENTALRSPLEAPLSLEEMPKPTAASPQTPSSSSSNTSHLSPDAGRIRYPATLPISGAQPAGDWHGFSQRTHARQAHA
jgi:hypothetical protein